VGEVGGVVGELFDVEEEGSGDVLGEEVGVGVGGGAGWREGGVEDDGVGVVEADEEFGGGDELVDVESVGDAILRSVLKQAGLR